MELEFNSNIELRCHRRLRMSLSDTEKQNFVLQENGNCEGFLEMQMTNDFCEMFCILDLDTRDFSYYTDDIEKRKDATKVGSIEVQDITKVSDNPQKVKKSFAFEVNTPAEKYILAASNERDMQTWIQALKKAAMSPVQVQPRKKDSLMIQQLNSKEAHKTAIIGGCVITTPVSTLERRNNSNTFTPGGLRILKEGFCWKQGAVMKNWKKRYFRLNAVNLSYYETKEDTTAIRSITTNVIRKVRILERFCNRSDVVEVETPSRKFYMDPENKEDVYKWRRAIEEIITQTTGIYLPRTKSV